VGVLICGKSGRWRRDGLVISSYPAETSTHPPMRRTAETAGEMSRGEADGQKRNWGQLSQNALGQPKVVNLVLPGVSVRNVGSNTAGMMHSVLEVTTSLRPSPLPKYGRGSFLPSRETRPGLLARPNQAFSTHFSAQASYPTHMTNTERHRLEHSGADVHNAFVPKRGFRVF
jgi:hypothetical protein